MTGGENFDRADLLKAEDDGYRGLARPQSSAKSGSSPSLSSSTVLVLVLALAPVFLEGESSTRAGRRVSRRARCVARERSGRG